MSKNNESRRLKRNRYKNIEEEETINRQLKELGMYDSESTLEEKKSLLNAVNESKEFADIESITREKSLQAEPTSEVLDSIILPSMFPRHIANEDDNYPLFHPSSDKVEKSSLQEDSFLQQPNRLPVNNELKGKVQDMFHSPRFEESKLPINTYAAKVRAASIKRNDTALSQDFCPVVVLDKLNHTAAEGESQGIGHLELIASHSGGYFHSNSVLTPTNMLKGSNGESEDTSNCLLNYNEALAVNEEFSSDLTSEIRVTKGALIAMKLRAQSASELLRKIQTIDPIPLSYNSVADFDRAYHSVIEIAVQRREKQLEATRRAKWEKPISLNVGVMKQKQIHNPQSMETSPLPRRSTRQFGLEPKLFDTPENSQKIEISNIIESLESPKLIAPRIKETTSDSDNEMLHVEKISKEFLKEKNDVPIPSSETSICPICNRQFSLNIIEEHAAECFNYIDESEHSGTRPTRTTRSNSNGIVQTSTRQTNTDSSKDESHLPMGRNGLSDKLIADILEENDLKTNMEIDEDSGNKRSRRPNTAKGKKRRR